MTLRFIASVAKEAARRQHRRRRDFVVSSSTSTSRWLLRNRAEAKEPQRVSREFTGPRLTATDSSQSADRPLGGIEGTGSSGSKRQTRRWRRRRRRRKYDRTILTTSCMLPRQLFSTTPRGTNSNKFLLFFVLLHFSGSIKFFPFLLILQSSYRSNTFHSDRIVPRRNY